MPYKDPQKKREWEWQHRSQRLSRRRELRRIEMARKATRPVAPMVQAGGGTFLLPVVAGGALAAHNAKLAIGAGGLTLLLAALYKKGWRWWIAGTLILILGLFCQWNNTNVRKGF